MMVGFIIVFNLKIVCKINIVKFVKSFVKFICYFEVYKFLIVVIRWGCKYEGRVCKVY